MATAPQSQVTAEIPFTELLRTHVSRLRSSDFISFLQSSSQEGDEGPAVHSSSLNVKHLPYRIGDLPHSKPGFIGIRKASRKVPSLDLLLAEGYQIIPYEGKTTLFADCDGLVHMVLVPCPEELESSGLNDSLVGTLAEAKESINFSATNTTGNHKPGERSSRGGFPTISSGISHGGGQTEPRILNHVKENRAALDRLSSTDAIICIASWQNECYRRWMPKLYKANDDVIIELLRRRKGLRRNFYCSVFGSITYNFGPDVVCDFHVDFLNWAPGGCAITAAGKYDHTKGGHLVLEDAKVILEFPPCTTIIIPSAMMTHGNLPIAPGETRYSVTQYTAGGLFRWVHLGHQATATLSKTPAALIAEEEENGQRWCRFMKLYSPVSDLTV